MQDRVRISKTLSLWLRHRPAAGGLQLDAQGWASVDDVLAALARRGVTGGFETLLMVVETNDKRRYEFSADLTRIRARQGHSVEVDLALTPCAPPDVLFHGTVERFLAAILAEGLSKMGRHHVHLSADVETARKVGARRGAPVILAVAAGAMAADGALFYLSANGVWLADHVPAGYLRRL